MDFLIKMNRRSQFYIGIHTNEKELIDARPHVASFLRASSLNNDSIGLYTHRVS